MAKIHRVRPAKTIPQASLADVAFLLLIFFIATTTIGEEFGLTLDLPQKMPALSRPVRRENVMVIKTDPSGSVYYVDEIATELELIRDLVRGRRELDDQLVVSVEPDPAAPYRAMVDILDELKLGGATRISLQTRRP